MLTPRRPIWLCSRREEGLRGIGEAPVSQVEWAVLWAEAAACPRPARESRSPAEPPRGATCILLPAVCLPRKPSWPRVHLMSVSCSSCVPLVSLPYLPRGTEAWGGGGVGGGQGHRKCLVGACGPGQSWQPPQEERTFRGRLKSFHSSLLPPPPPHPQLQRRRALGGRVGGWGLKPAESASSLPPGTLGRAERAMALASQAPSPGRPPH